MPNYPTSLDSLTNPTNTDKLNNPSHALQHQNVNDIVEALEAKLGIGASTPTAGKVLRATGAGTTSYGQVDITTDVAAFSSANLRTALTDETGTGSAVFATSPTIVTPTIASFANANHDHTNSAGGGTLGTNAVSSASILATGVVTSPKQSTELQQGWESSYGGTTFPPPSTVTCNGNRSYDLVFNSVDLTGAVSPGMRIRTTRTVAAPTQCADLESGSSQYFSKANATGFSTGTTWTFKAKIKLESYAVGVIAALEDVAGNQIQFYVNASGTLSVSGGTTAANDVITSYQSVPLAKWIDVTGSITIGTPTGEMRFDDVVVPSVVGASAATTMTISGDETWYIGRNGSGNYFDGKIAQVAVFNAIISDATLKTYSSQTMTGSETNCKGFWSLNGVLTDSSASANTVTGSGGAVATNADSPFSVNSFGTATGTTDYGIITAATFSTNTTLTVQVPEGNTIPTSGGVSALAYSTQKSPYGFPTSEGKWLVESICNISTTTAGLTATQWLVVVGNVLTIPSGKMIYGYRGFGQENAGGVASSFGHLQMASSTPGAAVYSGKTSSGMYDSSAQFQGNQVMGESETDNSSATVFNMYGTYSQGTATVNMLMRGDLEPTIMYCWPSGL